MDTGAHLHSRYNPQAEARRYIDSLNLKETTNCFILIEPGLGYIIPVLQERFKTGKIIVLHIVNFSHDKENTASNFNSGNLNVIRQIFPPDTDSKKVQKFLETHIPQTGIDCIRVIDWRPSLNYYKEAYLNLLTHVVEFLKRADAESRTTAAFGKRWVRNFFRNIAYINKIVLYRQSKIPVIITGSGPSLESALPLISKVQTHHLIIATSSSVTALSHNSVIPDIIIETDGGPWALWHIYPAIRNKLIYSALHAVNLCAALPSQCINTPFLILNDGSLWQSIILHELSIPSIMIPQKGTVSAAAAELAMILSSGNIFLSGMDFSVNDIRTHVRPYGFDSLFFSRANRFGPVYSQAYSRSTLLKQGRSLDIYASWFKSQLDSWPKRIFTAGQGNKIFEKTNMSMFSDNTQDTRKTKNMEMFFNCVNIENARFREKGAKALIKALKNPEYSEKIKQELLPLLFPGDDCVTEKTLENAIHEISHE
ncbi:MAG: DUF115 domain-containing protein [Treponema sp.]|jgi:hypothetical protein|nr:DUF115 domain-containing protein [Treponema sp.]